MKIYGNSRESMKIKECQWKNKRKDKLHKKEMKTKLKREIEIIEE